MILCFSRDGTAESSGKRREMTAKLFNDRSGQESKTTNRDLVIPRIQNLLISGCETSAESFLALASSLVMI